MKEDNQAVRARVDVGDPAFDTAGSEDAAEVAFEASTTSIANASTVEWPMKTSSRCAFVERHRVIQTRLPEGDEMAL